MNMCPRPLVIITNKGNAIERWYDIIGTIPHGYYRKPQFQADWYSGHFILTLDDKSKVTDLNCQNINSGWNWMTTKGMFRKNVYSVRNYFRIHYRFTINQLQPWNFHLGIFTLLPDGWDKKSLYYCTVNGGTKPEYYPMTCSFDHSRSLIPQISAEMCLGSTEGWVGIGDKDKKVLITRTMNELYTVPMIWYEDMGDQWFARIVHTAWETDDTTQNQPILKISNLGIKFTVSLVDRWPE